MKLDVILSCCEIWFNLNDEMNRKQSQWNLVCVPPSQKQRETLRTIEIHLKDLHCYPAVIQLIRVTTKESGQNGRQSTQEKEKKSYFLLKLIVFLAERRENWSKREGRDREELIYWLDNKNTGGKCHDLRWLSMDNKCFRDATSLVIN